MKTFDDENFVIYGTFSSKTAAKASDCDWHVGLYSVLYGQHPTFCAHVIMSNLLCNVANTLDPTLSSALMGSKW